MIITPHSDITNETLQVLQLWRINRGYNLSEKIFLSVMKMTFNVILETRIQNIKRIYYLTLYTYTL